MIEMHLCEGGDLFVVKDRQALSSPYGNGPDFWRELSTQKHVTLRFDSMEDVERSFVSYLGTWASQLPKVIAELNALGKRSAGQGV